MKLTYYDIKEQVIKLKNGIIKRIITEKPVVIKMPNTFDGMVLGIKKLAKGWKLTSGPGSNIACVDGYCIMGTLARQITPDVDKFPGGAAEVLEALKGEDENGELNEDAKRVTAVSLPQEKLIDRLIGANDNAVDNDGGCKDRIRMLFLLGIKTKGKRCEDCGTVHA